MRPPPALDAPEAAYRAQRHRWEDWGWGSRGAQSPGCLQWPGCADPWRSCRDRRWQRESKSPRLPAPSQYERTETVRDFDQPRPSRRMQRLQGKTDCFVLDDAAFLHQRLACDEATLAIFIVDQRQPAFIGSNSLAAAAREIRIRELAHAV